MFVVIRRMAACFLFCAALTSTAVAQDADAPIQTLLQSYGAEIKKSSRKSIGPAIDALAASGTPDAQTVLGRWQAKDMWFDKDSGLFVFGQEGDDGAVEEKKWTGRKSSTALLSLAWFCLCAPF